MKVSVLPDSYRVWLTELLTREWGSPRIVTRGKVHNAAELPALLALWEESPAAVLTYRIAEGQCEIISLNSVIIGKGAASALINAVTERAREADCHRLWLITTNDNIDALEFYQRRGFVLKAVYPKSIEEMRRLKPEIPLTGRSGLPIRDEIELEMEI